MLNFKTIETLKPNSTIIDIIKSMTLKREMARLKFLKTQI